MSQMNKAFLLVKFGQLLERLGHELQEPVFVIGTGRCGSSLLTRILRSHKQVVGFPGEANELWHPHTFPYYQRTIETPTIIEDPKRFSKASVSAWPTNHRRTIRRAFSAYHFLRGSPNTFFVKSAMISFLIPQIITIFPDARFIHIFRSGPHVVASLVKKEWHKHAEHFDNKVEFQAQCARYWTACIVEIEQKNQDLSLVQRKALLEISYETLCERPSFILDQIANFLDISAQEFEFDISRISNRNNKIGDYEENEAWAGSLDIMSKGMELKGYPITR